MTDDTIHYETGETPMTDYQTKILLAALADTLNSSSDINEARARFSSITGGGFTSAKSAAAMRTDNAENETAMPMTDFQYKKLIEMVYQILKANFEAGKTPEEILAVVAALKNEPKAGA